MREEDREKLLGDAASGDDSLEPLGSPGDNQPQKEVER